MRVFASRRRIATTSRFGGRLYRERLPEDLRGSLDVFFTHHLSPSRPAHELRQHAPHHALMKPGAARGKHLLALAMFEDLQHLRARPSVMLSRGVRVRVVVKEGESHEVGLQQRPGRELAPEGDEDVVKALPQRVAIRHLVGDEAGVGQLALGEGPYRPRDALLAAVVTIQRAHREPRGPGQFRGPDVVETPLRQQLRRVTQPESAHLRQRVHSPVPLPSRPSRGRNVPSTMTCLQGGSDTRWEVGSGASGAASEGGATRAAASSPRVGCSARTRAAMIRGAP